MEIIAQILFIAVLAATTYLVVRRASLISRTIKLGRDEDRTDKPAERLKTMLLIAFGQKKMFNRPVVGFLHFIVYAGFIIINVEVLEIIIDGIFGSHRIFAGPLGGSYAFFINFFEFLAVGVFVAVTIFLIRRNIVNVPRLTVARHRELKGWPKLDANLILIIEMALMWAFISMNAADVILQGRGIGHYGDVQTGSFLFSQFLMPLFDGFSSNSLVIYERAAWWFHILGIMAFAVYVTYSKHLHIALAFPNTYFAKLKPKGEMDNMPAVTNEVKIMLGTADAPETEEEAGTFGAKDVQDLSWKNLMDAYSCTECGRCTDVCPANMTGKLLSPRKIMMDTRDRMEDIQHGWIKNGNDFTDEKTLLGDYIIEEEILACTTCNACVEACPILINPLDIILQLRRYKVMEESDAPQPWNMMFQNLETNMAPWKFSPSDRFNWAQEVKED